MGSTERCSESEEGSLERGGVVWCGTSREQLSHESAKRRCAYLRRSLSQLGAEGAEGSAFAVGDKKNAMPQPGTPAKQVGERGSVEGREEDEMPSRGGVSVPAGRGGSELLEHPRLSQD